MKVRDLLKVIKSINDVQFKELDPNTEFDKLMDEEFQDRNIKTLTITCDNRMFVELQSYGGIISPVQDSFKLTCDDVDQIPTF